MEGPHDAMAEEVDVGPLEEVHALPEEVHEGVVSSEHDELKKAA